MEKFEITNKIQNICFFIPKKNYDKLYSHNVYLYLYFTDFGMLKIQY